MDTRLHLFVYFVFCQLAGFAFYVISRGVFYHPDFLLYEPTVLEIFGIHAYAPSVIFVASVYFLTKFYTGDRRLSSRITLVSGLGVECVQSFASLGTFDVFDIAATLAVWSVLVLKDRQSFSTSGKSWKLVVLGFVAVSQLATSQAEKYNAPPMRIIEDAPSQPSLSEIKPKYISRAELDASFEVGESDDIKNINLAVESEDRVYIASNNQGVFVFEKDVPLFEGYYRHISIPGVSIISISGDYLFANRFTDLLVIDISSDEPVLVHAYQDVFEWNPYSAISDETLRFPYDSVKESKGFIVGVIGLDEQLHGPAETPPPLYDVSETLSPSSNPSETPPPIGDINSFLEPSTTPPIESPSPYYNSPKERITTQYPKQEEYVPYSPSQSRGSNMPKFPRKKTFNQQFLVRNTSLVVVDGRVIQTFNIVDDGKLVPVDMKAARSDLPYVFEYEEENYVFESPDVKKLSDFFLPKIGTFRVRIPRNYFSLVQQGSSSKFITRKKCIYDSCNGAKWVVSMFDPFVKIQGHELWRSEEVSFPEMALHGESLYVCNKLSKVLKFDLSSESLSESIELTHIDSCQRISPTDNFVIVEDEAGVHKYDNFLGDGE